VCCITHFQRVGLETDDPVHCYQIFAQVLDEAKANYGAPKSSHKACKPNYLLPSIKFAPAVIQY
jgi:hypothetical protein